MESVPLITGLHCSWYHRWTYRTLALAMSTVSKCTDGARQRFSEGHSMLIVQNIKCTWTLLPGRSGAHPCTHASTHFASLEPLPRPISLILPPNPTTQPLPPSNLCSVLPFLPSKQPAIQVSSPCFALFHF